MGGNEISPEGQSQSLARPGPVGLQKPEVLDVSAEEIAHLLGYWQIILKRRERPWTEAFPAK